VNSSEGYESPLFSLSRKYGFTVVQNGPEAPKKIAIICGGSSKHYEEAVAKGVDTFIVGEIKEQVPAISLDTGTNFVNLGHYFSEKPGVLELQKRIQAHFDVKTVYIEIVNPV
jgi:putative NIF3 family GTP cyclohydrolase 1 type 2